MWRYVLHSLYRCKTNGQINIQRAYLAAPASLGRACAACSDGRSGAASRRLLASFAETSKRLALPWEEC